MEKFYVEMQINQPEVEEALKKIEESVKAIYDSYNKLRCFGFIAQNKESTSEN